MDRTYLQRVKEVVKINHLYHLEESMIWEMLDSSKAITFDGHFELLSKKHSDTFFRFAAISQYPSFVAKISKEMVAWLTTDCEKIADINVVLGPASQGMFFAYDIAREFNGRMGCRAVYTAIDNDGSPKGDLIEGFDIKPGENVLIVNDMATTGNGLERLAQLVEKKCGANVVAICLFANRGMDEEKIQLLEKKYKFHSILDLNMPSWPKKQCNQKCNQNRMLIHSGKLNHLPIYTEENAYDLYVAKLQHAA
ncbi:MAG: phosphoribosyltransferase family protein [Candidatus Desantisbacteria bacterium]